VPAFSSLEDIARWLADKPRDVAVVFAARVALRVVPLLVRTFRLGGPDVNAAQRDIVLRTFRCVQVAWAVAASPGQAALLQRAAKAAGRAPTTAERLL
jgi:hypothetical protein